nr:unnamed protein product [Digitaria exilis]
MNTLVVLLIQAPMSEPSAMEREARLVDAEMLLETTLSASAVSSVDAAVAMRRTQAALLCTR